MQFWVCDCGRNVDAPTKKCKCGVEWDDSRAMYRPGETLVVNSTPSPKTLSSVLGTELLKHLYEQGVVSGMAERIIIDIQVDAPVKIYVQEFASEAFMSVLLGKPMILALIKSQEVQVEGDKPCQNTEPTKD